MKIEQPGAYTFLQLLDTPNSYFGETGKFTAVNLTETALTFQPGGGGGSPGGVIGNIQFNGGGVFSGENQLNWTGVALETSNIVSLSGTDLTLTANGANWKADLSSSSGQFQFRGVIGQPGILDFESLTAPRTYTFPNSSGTLALVQSLPTWINTQINVPSGIKNYGVFEHTQVISAPGVVPTNFIEVLVGPHTDQDENTEQGLSIISLTAVAGTNEFTVNVQFYEKTTGIIKLKYKVN